MLKLVGDTGVQSVIWNYACHPVMFPQDHAVSSHYPGVVRDSIRSETGASTPVVFFQGFSGDIRPLGMAEPRIPPTLRHLYRRVRYGTEWALQDWNMETYTQWAHSLAAVALKAFSRGVDITSNHRTEAMIQATRRGAPRGEFVEPDGAPVQFQVVRLGREFGLLAVGAEVVAAYAKNARRRLGTRYSMLVGCADEPFGYIPTAAMLRQGGYEAGGFLQNFSLTAINPRVEANTVANIDRVTSRL